MSDIVMTPVRMERWLRNQAGETAAAKSLSLNKFMVAAIARAVSDAAAVPDSANGQATYEITVRFDVDDDSLAYEVLDQVASVAGLAGASAVMANIARLVSMQPRS